MKSRYPTPVVAGLAFLLALLLLGAALINLYVNRERQRDLLNWESRLGLIADARVDAVEAWLRGQFAGLEELAGNASLQLYLWQLSQRGGPADEPAGTAQLGYLRNLLLASADRLGYADEDAPRIRANLPQRRASGLALLDADGEPVVATPGMPAIGEALRDTVRKVLADGRPALGPLYLDEQEHALLGFVVPVHGVLGTASGRQPRPVGVLLGLRDAGRELFPLLTGGAPLAERSETLLVRRDGDSVVYLSPGTDGSKPTRRRLPLDRPRLAAAAAVTSPGGFGEFLDHQGRPVLAVSRPLRSAPWVLVQEVDAAQALRESDQHRRFLVITLSLLLLFVAALVIAAWRHGSSVRARQQADELRDKTLALQKQTELLHAITDNVDAYTLLLDENRTLLFANRAVAEATGARVGELAGNSLTAVLGPDAAGRLQQAIGQAGETRQRLGLACELAFGKVQGMFQCTLVPVERIGEHRNALLLVLHDITELQRAQQRHARLLRKLVQTLMHVVDLHDPWSAHHSSRMVEVANALARELQLDEQDRRTLDLAASLANLGKIFIPKEILTKTEPLTGAEQELLQRHVRYGLELLEDLEFEGPVLATIAQKQEYIDGSGYPEGLTGEQMLMTGRILAVANAFVALVSPRAWRGAVSVEDALDQLLKDAGSKYDRHVVAALFHVAENRADWSRWPEEAPEP